MNIVYVLKSIHTQHFYIGQTKNLLARLEYHNAGKVRWTSRYAPWKIVYQEKFSSRSEALKREKYFKSHAGRNWLKKLRTRSSVGPSRQITEPWQVI